MKQGYKYSYTEMKMLAANWKKFAADNNGKTIVKKIVTNSFQEDTMYRKFEVRIPFLKKEIVFKTDEFRPLKVRYDFEKSSEKTFLIYQEDFTDRIAKKLGAKEFEVGDGRFDQKFMIKGNDFDLVKKVISNKVQAYLLDNHIANFKLEKEKGQSFLELNIVVNELEYEEMEDLLEVYMDIVKVVKDNL